MTTNIKVKNDNIKSEFLLWSFYIEDQSSILLFLLWINNIQYQIEVRAFFDDFDIEFL